MSIRNSAFVAACLVPSAECSIPAAEPRGGHPDLAGCKSKSRAAKLGQSLVFAAFFLGVLLVRGRGDDGQTITLDSLKSSYEKTWASEIGETYAKKEKAALIEYGKALDVLMAALKQKGDVKTYPVVEAEKKRIATGGNGPDAKPADPVLAAAFLAYQKSVVDAQVEQNRQTARLLRQHIAALNGLIGQLTQAGKVEQAKAAIAERSKAASELAFCETAVPGAVASVPATAVKPAKMGIPSGAKAFKWHHYLFVAEKKKWHEASRACEEMGGHLVTITSREEDEFVFKLTNGNNAWIGCTDEEKEGRWTWVTGERFSYKNWADGQPDNHDHDPFGFYWEKTPGRWADVSDRFLGPLGFICEWEH